MVPDLVAAAAWDASASAAIPPTSAVPATALSPRRRPNSTLPQPGMVLSSEPLPIDSSIPINPPLSDCTDVFITLRRALSEFQARTEAFVYILALIVRY